MSAQPVTKDDLDHAIQQSESRVRDEIQQNRDEIQRNRDEIKQTESRLMKRLAEALDHTVRVMMDRMDRFAAELGQDLARHVRASEERTLAAIRALDDQYRTLPGETARLRRGLDAHVADDRRHPGPGGGRSDTDG